MIITAENMADLFRMIADVLETGTEEQIQQLETLMPGLLDMAERMHPELKEHIEHARNLFPRFNN